MQNKTILTIDGPAASGKGTVAHGVAHLFDMAVLDTGLLYRLIGLAAHRAGIPPDDEVTVTALAVRLAGELQRTPSLLDDPDLRGRTAGVYASVYAAIPGARAALIDFQRDFAIHPPPFPDGRHPSGAVLDGRDCGTIICPEAPLKLYVTAHVDVRAHRRHRDLTERGEAVTYNDVLQDLMARDHRDMTRAAAPTLPAEDAVMIDTTNRPAEDIVAQVADLVTERLHLSPMVLDRDVKKHPEELA